MIKILKKMNLLLDGKQKAQMGGIMIMMLIGGVLESVGVAMAIPVLQIIIDPTTTQTNKYMHAIYEGFHMTSTFQFAITAMIGLIFAFVIKNVFLFRFS